MRKQEMRTAAGAEMVAPRRELAAVVSPYVTSGAGCWVREV